MEEEEWNRHQHDMPLTLSFTQIPLHPTFSLSFPLAHLLHLPFSSKAACSMCLRRRCLPVEDTRGRKKHYFVCMKVLLSCGVCLYGVLSVRRFSAFALMLI